MVIEHEGRAPEIAEGAHVAPNAVVRGDVVIREGAAVLFGARIGAGSEVRIHGVVHVNSRLSPGAVVPIGWIAVGDPAEVLPPGEHERIWEIQKTLDFPGTVFEATRETPKGERTRRYARALQRQKKDRILRGSGPDGAR